jgi:hypothetical protein
MQASAARTIIVGSGVNASLNAAVLGDALRWPLAGPGANRDYTLDLTAPLADMVDTLATVSVSVAPSGAGELRIVSLSATSTLIGLRLAGGVPGRNYTVVVDAVTEGGEELEYAIGLMINPLLGVWPLSPPPSFGFGPVATCSAETESLDFSKPSNSGLIGIL